MFFVPTDIWMLVVPVVIIWLLIQAGKGIGHSFSDSSSLPEGVLRIRLRNMTDENFRSRVLWAYSMPESGVYFARVRCDILNKEEPVEASSKKELEQKIDETYVLFNKEYKQWRHKKIYGR